MDPITPCLKGFSKICLYKSTISAMVLMGILKFFFSFKKGFSLDLVQVEIIQFSQRILLAYAESTEKNFLL